MGVVYIMAGLFAERLDRLASAVNQKFSNSQREREILLLDSEAETQPLRFKDKEIDAETQQIIDYLQRKRNIYIY